MPNRPAWAQRHLARVADDDVEPEQQDGVDRDGLDEVDVVRVVDQQGKGGEGGEADRCDGEGAAFHSAGFLGRVPVRPS
jgi:hypothetical protein